MSELRLESDVGPAGDVSVVVALIRLRERLAFVGILPLDHAGADHGRRDDHFARLADETLGALDHLGVGSVTVARLRRSADPAAWERGLAKLTEHVESSPVPPGTWPVLAGLLGLDLVAGLVGASRASARRYRTGQRQTPDDVATRLHALAMICADLAGSYNDFGIRRWFARPRSALDGRTPAEVLAGGWAPEDPGPQQVRRLAAALADPGAT